MTELEEIKTDLLEDLKLNLDFNGPALQELEAGNSRYLKDLRINLKNALRSAVLSEEEITLLGIALSANAKNKLLLNYFKQRATEQEITPEKIAEAVACASLLSSNNVLYRFRHFTNKEAYEKLPAKIKMNIMMKPELGKEFFELISLAVSAVNGCELCVKSHEQSLIALGSSEARIFDSIRLASVINSTDRIFWS